MNPEWFHGVQPRTLNGQQAEKKPNIAFALRRLVVSVKPLRELRTLVPGGAVPNHDQESFSLLSCDSQHALEKLDGHGAVRLTVGPKQVALLSRRIDGAVTRNGFLTIVAGRCSLDQSHLTAGFCPGMHLWLSKAAEPTFVLVNE